MFKKIQAQWGSLFSLALATLIAVREYTYQPTYYKDAGDVAAIETIQDDSFQQDLEFSLKEQTNPSDKQTVYVESVDSLSTSPSETVQIISRGDTLQSILKKLSISPKQIEEIVKSLKKVCSLKDFKPGQKIHIKTEKQDSSISLLHLEFRPNLESIISLKKTYQGFVARKDPIKFKRALKRAMGVVKSSFYSSLTKSGVPTSLVKEIISSLSYSVNFQHGIKPGDPFEVLFETFVNSEGDVVKTGKLLYAGFAAAGQVHTVYQHTSTQGQTGYYNVNGESLRRNLLQTPIEASKMRITSKFGMRRHPLKGFTLAHKGVDLGAHAGTAVMAAGDGVVVKAGYNGDYGNYVLIRHPGEYQTAYAHLQKIGSGIRPGAPVKQRQVIGAVGQTGNSTGNHLHFEVLKHGVHINPLSVKMLPVTKLSGKEAQRFQQTKKDVQMHIAGVIPQKQYAQVSQKDIG